MFKRQFILYSNRQYFSDLISLQLGEYHIHLGSELKFSRSIRGNSEIIAIGDLYDYRNPQALDHEILSGLRIDGNSDEFYEDISHLCGNYILLLRKEYDVFLIPDMACTKEVYIYAGSGEITMASSIPLLSKHVSLERADVNTLQGQFYNSAEFARRGIQVGNTTRHRGVFRAKANHTFHLGTHKFKRFFPRHKLAEISIDEAAEKASLVLKGILKSIAVRNRMLLPVTAGWDSRLLFACSREIQDEIIFYLLKHNSIPQLKFDLIVAKKLFKKLKIPFQVIEYSDHVSDETRKFVLSEIDLPNNNSMAYIFNAWKKMFATCVNVNGNLSEITRNEWGETKTVSGELFSELAKYPNNAFCISLYKQWLTDNEARFSSLGYSALDMFYWEEVMANRIAQAYTEINLGINMVSPYNCQFLIQTLLATPSKYRAKQDNLLYTRMITNLWPELLEVPINPGLKKRLIKLTQRLGIYNWYRYNLRFKKIFSW